MFSIQELRSSTKKELIIELEKSRKEMLKTRISLKTKHDKDTSKAGKIKRYIAQILTIMKEVKDEAPVAAVDKKEGAINKSVKKTSKK